ncbi:MAG TPA: DUF4388 domain-containing protein [Ktedonobacterales bacterium]
MAQSRIFQGRLEEFGLVDLIQTLGMDGQTGALHLHGDGSRHGVVYFDSGRLVGGQEQDRDALTLGNVLQQLQMATQAQMDHVYQMQVRDALGKRIGERLIELGIIAPQNLERALRNQTLWTVRELALWKRGTYAFHAGERMPWDATAPHTEVTAAVMEALRYLHEWESLEHVLPDGMRTALSMASDPPIDHSLQFLPAAWRIISRVNSHRIVRRIATSLRMPELDVARMVGALVRDGLLTPRRLGGRPGLPVEAERMNLEHFDLFTLLINMEQVWIKSKSEPDRLIALARFTNETMAALEETYASSGVELAPTTLASLLDRTGIRGVGDHVFTIRNNRIDIDAFSEHCHKVFGSQALTGGPSSLFVQYRDELERALEVAFGAINDRIVDPEERVQNHEAWVALFQTFAGAS